MCSQNEFSCQKGPSFGGLRINPYITARRRIRKKLAGRVSRLVSHCRCRQRLLLGVPASSSNPLPPRRVGCVPQVVGPHFLSGTELAAPTPRRVALGPSHGLVYDKQTCWGLGLPSGAALTSPSQSARSPVLSPELPA